MPALVVYSICSEALALKLAWTVKGPPCAVVAQPSRLAVSRRKPPKTFQYGGISFTRSFAAVSCAAVPENPFWPRESYRVCQFNNPGAVIVRTTARSVTFEPPAGQRATVTVRRGQISCVVGGTFNL